MKHKNLYNSWSVRAREQVPEFRGSMMSMNSVASNVGSAIGASLGGLILVLTNWSMLGLVFGVITLLAATIYYRYTIDTPEDVEL